MRLFCFYLICCISALGNGGGYRHGVSFTGGIAPFTAEGTEYVQIVDEKLDIDLYPEYAEVKVRYHMKNVSKKAVSVKFGFPVEDSKDEWDFHLEEKKPVTKLSPRYCRDYSVRLRGKSLKYIYELEPFASGKVKPFKGAEVLVGIEGWMVSKMRLAAEELIVLEISYKSMYDYSAFSISSDGTVGPWIFKYRFSSGAIWHGPIKNGVVTIRNKGCDPKDILITTPVNIFKKDGESYFWNFSNLEPTLADDLNVAVRSGFSHHYKHGGSGPDSDADPRYNEYISHNAIFYDADADYRVTASSELKPENNLNYKAQNVSPMHIDGKDYAWAEGAASEGVGESITLTLDKPSPVSAILVSNGYGKSEASFKENCRVADCTLIINGKHKIKHRLYDYSSEQILSLETFKGKVETISLVIDSVHAGSKYKDCCVSEIVILHKLKKEPKRYGAR